MIVTSVPANVTPTVPRPVSGTLTGSGGSNLGSSSSDDTSSTNTDGATGITVATVAKPDAPAPITMVDTSANPQLDTSAIQGVWDISDTEEGEETDFEYLEIGDNGEFFFLDDQFDDDGDFADCLINDDDSFFLTPEGDDEYILTEVSLDATGAVVSELTDLAMFVDASGLLNVISQDTDDENSNGQTDDFVLNQYPSIDFDINSIPDCTDTSAITGLWDASYIDEATGLEDVLFVEIGLEGQVTVIDDQLDDFDAGENCYIKAQTEFTPAGGDPYDTADGDTLSIVNDGGLKLILSGNLSDQEVWPPVEGFTTADDFNDCVI